MAQIWIDDFETADPSSGDRSASAHADTDNGSGPALGGTGDYFFRTMQASADTSTGLNVSFTGFNGSYLWRGEDVEDSAGGGANPALGFINWTGIDIAGDTDLSFSGLFGAREFTGANFTFETSDFITVRFAIDGGGFTDGLSFRGTGVANAQMAQDSNLDGVIDGSDNGMLLSHALASFGFTIAGTGTTLALQLETNVGFSEEIAFDDIAIDGTVAGGPIDGTPGNDNLMGTAGDDVINGLGGNDTLSGFGTNETDGGNDTLNGGEGNDRLFGQGGEDILNGEGGNDQLWGQEGADALDGGTGTDGAYYINATAGVALNVATGGTGGHAAGDTYVSIERFFGSQFADLLDGAGDNDFLYGLGGDDLINGGAGNDLLVGGLGMDTINGGAGNDRILGSQGIDTLNGDGDNDNISGGAGNDIVNGGDGNDSLDGGAGSDALNGGAGIDRAIYTSATAAVVASLESGGSFGDAMGDTFVDVENLYGSFFNDGLDGDGANNLIVGLAGNDQLNGGGGNDRLIGGEGTDQLDGGEGNDILIGQAGADLFLFSGGSSVGEVDRILDFEDGSDTIILSQFGDVFDFSDLTLTQVGNHVRIEEDTGATGGSNDAAILVFNTMVADLTADDFTIIPPPATAEPLGDDFAKAAPAEDAVALYSNDATVAFVDNQWEISQFDIDFGSLI